MKVVIVFGTRPESIKLAPVVRALREAEVAAVVCASGQHRAILDQALEVFDLKPDHDLDVMRPDQRPLEAAARVMERLPAILDRERPDWLLVQGDTITTFAAALVGFHHRVRVGHVEAGLRTGVRDQPFPEEMNRTLTTALADLHFAPTPRALESLGREGVPRERMFLTGNTIVDALHTMLRAPVTFLDPRLRDLRGDVVVVTAHRRESFGEPLARICAAVRTLVARRPSLTVVFPVHPNPAVRSAAAHHLTGHARIVLVDPVPYPEFVHLMKRAALILTDSGGIQEEAPTVGTPVLVMREVTERPEAIESGWAELVGTSTEAIVASAEVWLTRGRRIGGVNPFGDGRASERITRILLERTARGATGA